MASKLPFKRKSKPDFWPQAYDAEKLELLQQAFDVAWAELLRTGYSLPAENQSDLRTALGEKIMALATGGDLDPQRLSSRALQSFPGRP